MRYPDEIIRPHLMDCVYRLIRSSLPCLTREQKGEVRKRMKEAQCRIMNRELEGIDLLPPEHWSDNGSRFTRVMQALIYLQRPEITDIEHKAIKIHTCLGCITGAIGTEREEKRKEAELQWQEMSLAWWVRFHETKTSRWWLGYQGSLGEGRPQ